MAKSEKKGFVVKFSDNGEYTINLVVDQNTYVEILANAIRAKTSPADVCQHIFNAGLSTLQKQQ